MLWCFKLVIRIQKFKMIQCWLKYSRQSRSSEPSRQSRTRSHFLAFGKQTWPSHWNSSAPHRTSTSAWRTKINLSLNQYENAETYVHNRIHHNHRYILFGHYICRLDQSKYLHMGICTLDNSVTSIKKGTR